MPSSPLSRTGSPTLRQALAGCCSWAGEAGIGKTRLLGSIARRARTRGFAVFHAAAFPGDVQSLAGLMLDLASDLMSAPEPVLGQLGQSLGGRALAEPRLSNWQSLASRIRVIPANAGDAHHRRRLLVQDVGAAERPGSGRRWSAGRVHGW